MTSGKDLDLAGGAGAPAVGSSTRSSVRQPRRRTVRRNVTGVLAAFAVVAFAGAMVAPTGVALAEQQPAEDVETTFSLAVADTQGVTVTVEGATIEPMERSAYDVYVTPPPEPEPEAEPASTPSDGGGPLYYTGGGAPAEWMAAAGIPSSDWGYVDYVVSRESGWNPNATNSSSGACGLVQAYPCSKVPGNGYDPVDNLRWANGYATGRYGSWEGAVTFWKNNHWW